MFSFLFVPELQLYGIVFSKTTHFTAPRSNRYRRFFNIFSKEINDFEDSVEIRI